MSKKTALPAPPPGAPQVTGRPVAEWMLLLSMGGISAWFNIRNSLRTGDMPIDLALLAGVAPVLAAMLSSHIVAKAASDGDQPLPRRRRTAPRGIDRSAEAEAARKLYRKSKAQGAPLSDRKLAAEFGRSRTWGTNRISEVEESPLGIAATGTDHGRA